MKLPLSPSLSPRCVNNTVVAVSVALTHACVRSLRCYAALSSCRGSLFRCLSLSSIVDVSLPTLSRSLSLHKVVCFEIAFLVVVVVFVCQSVSLTRRTRRRRRQRRQQRAPARKVNKVRCGQMQLCVCVCECMFMHACACTCVSPVAT